MSVTRSKADSEPASSQGVPDRIYTFFSSVKFTVLVLSLIATGSIVGTVVKQGASAEEYLSRYSESTLKFIKFFGLDDAYHAPWFYGLILLFALNLCLCTIGRFTRFMKSGRLAPKLPDEHTLTGMTMHFMVSGETGGIDAGPRQKVPPHWRGH